MRYVLLTIAFALALGCDRGAQTTDEDPAPEPKPSHAHGSVGPHGGVLAEWGEHEYHLEFTVDHAIGQATLYVLDGEARTARPIAAEHLILNLNLTPPVTLKLLANRQSGDAAGSASAFRGMHAAFREERSFSGTISGQVGTKQYSGDFTETPHTGHKEVAPTVTNDQPTPRERDLFLKPGGIYTQADIEKNGTTVPSIKFRGVAFEHDDNLKPGDKICPVTLNKADEKCPWWVNGKKYEFCCSPCLEKFVRQAKETPEKIKDPSAYLKQ